MNIEITEDDALILFEYFERVDDTDDLSFVHAAEYLVMSKISGQVCKGSSAMFKANYTELLDQARARVADGFEGEVPCFKAIET